MILVEVVADFALDDARGVVAEWLADHPEVADAAEVAVTHRDATGGLLAQAQGTLADGGPGLLLCGPYSARPEGAEAVPTWDVTIDGPTKLVAILDRIVTSVDLAAGGSAIPDERPRAAAADAEGQRVGVPAPLLYIGTLGRPRRTSWRRTNEWRQQLVDLVASHSPDHLVRLLALADGIVGQTGLGVATEYASRAPGWSAKQWPVTAGRVDLRQIVAALGRQLQRDVEQAAFEGVQITGATCVVSVHEPLVGVVHLADDIAALGERMDLLWVVPDQQGPLLPAALEDARTFSAHPELAAEVARALGVGPRRLDARLRDAAFPGQTG